MIFNYGFSIVGKSHIEKGTCCQDSHKIKKMENGWYVAAIADGVGSAKNSHIGSKIAADTVVDFCSEYMPWDYSVIGIKSMLRTAYNYAFKQILREAEKSGEPIESYDTTLSVVIYDGHRIIYGHSGDGAIIGLTIYGDYIQITKPQKGDDMVSVLPLRAGYTVWSIDTYEEELAAVMLITDGMLDGTLCPYLLKLSNVSEVYTPIASFFADPYGTAETEKKVKKIKKEIKDFITVDDEYNIDKFYDRLSEIYKKHHGEKGKDLVDNLKEKNYPIALMQSVQDDKTMVALINTETVFETKDIQHFSDPNWDDLQEEWNKKAYPHLYKEETVDATDDKTDIKSDEDGNDSAKNQEIKISTKSKETDTESANGLDENAKPTDVSEYTQTQNYKCQGKTKESLDNKEQNKQQVYYNPPTNPKKQNNQTNPQSAPRKHKKPKKKSLFGDLFEIMNSMTNFFTDDDID